MLKIITSEVPVGLENYYTATDNGQFRLNVEGVVPVSEVETLKAKNKEFRETNVTLMKDIEKYKGFSTVFGGENVSPEKLQEKIDALANTRVAGMTEEMKSKYDSQVSELTDKLSKTGSKLSELTLGNEVVKAATDHGVISSALEDVLFRAKNAFVVNEEGTVKFKEEKLDSNGKPYTVSGWMTEIRTKAPHLFAPSQGTGASRPSKTGSSRTQDTEPRSSLERLSKGLSQNNLANAKKIT